MKILSIGINQNTIKNNNLTQNLHQGLPQQKFELQNDTFIKSTPSFKGGEKIALDKGAKTMMELSAFLTAGFVAFKKFMGNEKDLQAANEGMNSNFLQEIINNLSGQNEEQLKQQEEDKQKLKQQADELKQLQEDNQALKQQNEELEQLKEDNQALKQQNEELEQLRAAFQKLKDQNQELSIKIAERENAVQAEAEAALTPEPQKTEEKPKDFQGVTFPKKWGVLSNDQKALKAVVTSITITPEYNEKLTAICKDILDKGSKDKKNIARTINLTSELQKCEGDAEKLKAVVDRYTKHKKAKGAADEPNVDNQEKTGNGEVTVAEEDKNTAEEQKVGNQEKTDDNSEATAEDKTKESSEKPLYKIPAPKLQGPKVVGKIDLSAIRPTRPTSPKKQKAAEKASDKTTDLKKNDDEQEVKETEPQKTADKSEVKETGAQKAADKSEAKETGTQKAADKSEVKETDSKKVAWTNSAVTSKSSKEKELPKYTCILPAGMISKSTDENITKILKFFEQRYLNTLKAEAVVNGTEQESVDWGYRCRVGLVNEEGILTEVDNNKDRGPICKYKNINASNASVVANAINNEPKFHKLFTFHAAVRFMERFINYTSDVPIQEQVSNGMKVLGKTIQKALSLGIEVIPHDMSNTNPKTKETTINKNATIIIPPEYFDDDAKKIFGTYPLKLGLCRAGKNNQKALICTIFPQGAY